MPRWSGQRVLVTGAAGFLGSHLVRRLVREGARVAALDRVPGPQGFHRLNDIQAALDCCPVDLGDRPALSAIVQRVQPAYVFHLAGRVDLSRTDEVAQACVQENIAATVNLCWSLRGVAVQALVLTSTTDVYGHNPVPYHEEQPVDPRCPYAVSKVAAEQFCRLFARDHQTPTALLRLSPVYGPAQAEARLIPSVVLAILRDRELPVTHGDQRRDYIYVDDAIRGLLLAATVQTAHGETINLGHQASVSLREIIELIRRLTETSWQPLYGRVTARVDEPQVYSCTGDKARRLLGWRPTVSLEDGLRMTIDAYRAHEGLSTVTPAEAPLSR